MAGEIGFEPMHTGVKVQCLTAWRHPNLGRATNTVVTARGCHGFQIATEVNQKTLPLAGASDGNRTHVTCLEGKGSTIELHPQMVVRRRFELLP